MSCRAVDAVCQSYCVTTWHLLMQALWRSIDVMRQMTWQDTLIVDRMHVFKYWSHIDLMLLDLIVTIFELVFFNERLWLNTIHRQLLPQSVLIRFLFNLIAWCTLHGISLPICLNRITLIHLLDIEGRSILVALFSLIGRLACHWLLHSLLSIPWSLR